MTTMPVAEAARRAHEVIDAVAEVFRGKRHVIELVMTAALARGHVLVEDVPGVGKTTLARVFARVLGLSHQRIQFASDLMPADITGIGIWKEASGRFEFQPGPIFCHVLLADEINRTTPRTQSALLESMAEGHVTVDGTTHALPSPFLVLATQNPREHHGTYPLPESQLDRFLVRLSVGYPDQAIERLLVRDHGAPASLERLTPLCDEATVRAMIAAAAEVRVADEILDYMMALLARTRDSARFDLGLSTRAAIGLYRAVQGFAMVQGRDFATPDDVRHVFGPVATHRVIPAGHAGGAPERSAVASMIVAVLESVPPPD
jgi:MoxR-like ATPase